MKSKPQQTSFRAIVVFLLITITFWVSDVLATDCTGTSMYLKSQAEVDSFQANHGDGGTCDTVPGFLEISGEDITNLDGLTALKHIGTSLQINNVPALANINGLSALEDVGGDLRIYDNLILDQLDGLASLTLIGGDLFIRSNVSLENIDGLSSLNSLGVDLEIGLNQALSNIDGLSALTSVNGNVKIISNEVLGNLDGLTGLTGIQRSLEISQNPALNEWGNFSKLTYVGGNLVLASNAGPSHVDGFLSLTGVGADLVILVNNLTNLDGFSSLQNVTRSLKLSGSSLSNIDGLSNLSSLGGNLEIFNLGLLGNLNGLSGLTSVGGDLRILGNSLLTNLDGLSSLAGELQSLEIEGNAALVNIDGLSSLVSVSANVTISHNGMLDNLDGFASLISIGENFYITENPVLKNIRGLSALSTIGGELIIQTNAALTSIDGFSSLSSVSAMVIENNNALLGIDGFSGMTSLTWPIFIYDNDMLANINGLSALTSLQSSLVISRNDSLTNMDGLAAVTFSTGGLEISHNAALTNIDGLSELTSASGGLRISYNDTLKNVDGLSKLTEVGGFLTIQGNKTLQNVDGLRSLVRISSIPDLFGYLSITGNESLQNLNGFFGLTHVDYSIQITGNDQLVNCRGIIPLLDNRDDDVSGPGPGSAGIPDLGGDVTLNSYHQGCKTIESILASEASATVNVQKIFSDSNPASVTVSLNCDGATTLVASDDDKASSGSPAVFEARRFIPEFEPKCNAEEITLPQGYTADESNCMNLLLTDGGTPTCEIFNQQNPVQIVVNNVFTDESNTEVVVELTCDTGQVTTDDPTASQIDAAEFTISDFAFSGAMCNASESLPDGYALKETTCTDLVITPGNGNNCTIINDVDMDYDGTGDSDDNCPAVANPDQADANNNGIGDACEQTTITDKQSQVVKAFETNRELEGDCRGVAEINGVLLAQIHVDEYGCELWKLDDAQGHSLFADINPGPVESVISTAFGYYEPYNGWIYFGAYDGVEKRMWRTDGQVVEEVEETEAVPGGFTSIPTNRADFNGRYYFLASSTADHTRLYSLDDVAIRPEPQTPLEANGRVYRVSTLFDKLVMTIEDDEHGAEPWVFDGDEFRILQDLVPGPESSLSPGYRWFFFDDSWVFSARTKQVGGYQPAYFRTDGVTVEKLPHTGPWMEPATNSGSIYTSNATYGVHFYYPGNGDTGLPVLRVGKESTSSYKIPLDLSRPSDASMAILGGDVLTLNHNRLFKLGETSAIELPFSLPTDWEDPVFKFVGSGDYFKHAYIKETGKDGDTRVWAWNFTEAGLLMAGENNVVTHAEYFRHIGNAIYFYGEDEQVGMALRRIPDVLIKPVPLLAAVTGSWYDPATSGQGFVLHPVDDQYTVISFYGFEDNGKPLWLTGVGQQQLKPGYTTEIAMNITSGGNFGAFTPGQITEDPWGTLKITFETCSKATAEFDGLSGQQTMHMVRLAGLEGINCYYSTPPAPEAAGITGSWYDPATSGQGLVLHPMNDQQMIVSFYGYKNDSERLWLIGAYNGAIVKGESLVIDMITAIGGRFGGFTPEDITESPWGTLTINFTDCDSATATLDGVDGQQTMHMVKLAGLQGSELN